MTRVLLVQQSIEPPGGGNGVGAWILQALCRDHAVTLFSWTEQDVARANRFWGTTVRPDDFATRTAPPTLPRLLRHAPTGMGLLRTHLMMRWCKQIQHEYDVLITANNEIDFGRPGIQYVHFPWAHDPRPRLDLRWYHRPWSVMRTYRALCRRTSGFSPAAAAANLTLVNSAWVGALFRSVYGVNPTVLFPPVPGEFPVVPWGQRRDGFVCIGRLSPEKEVEQMIAIIAAVRARGHAVPLHIVGTGGASRYGQQIRALAAAHGPWVAMHEDLSRDRLVDLLATHRYLIHGMRDEHFGMAVAEGVRAGCIPFVPNGGGQVEIVPDLALRYDTVDDAVRKITRVLDDPGLQAGLLAGLAARAEELAPENFVAAIRGYVRRFA